ARDREEVAACAGVLPPAGLRPVLVRRRDRRDGAGVPGMTARRVSTATDLSAFTHQDDEPVEWYAPPTPTRPVARRRRPRWWPRRRKVRPRATWEEKSEITTGEAAQINHAPRGAGRSREIILSVGVAAIAVATATM